MLWKIHLGNGRWKSRRPAMKLGPMTHSGGEDVWSRVVGWGGWGGEATEEVCQEAWLMGSTEWSNGVHKTDKGELKCIVDKVQTETVTISMRKRNGKKVLPPGKGLEEEKQVDGHS